jgi:alpha-mannosidase
MTKTSKYICIIVYFSFITALLVNSQNTKDRFKMQYEFARKTVGWLEGFSKSSGENDFIYHSLRHNVSASMLTRCTTGEMGIEWETAPVPENFKEKGAWFVWLAAIDLTNKNYNFDVSIDDKKRFTVTSGNRKNWRLQHDGGILEFTTFTLDQHGDSHGYMSLYAPKSWITPGRPVKIKIVGEKAGENTWIIVYQANDVISYLQHASKYEIWMDIFCKKKTGKYYFMIQAPSSLDGQTLYFESGSIKKSLVLKQKGDVAAGSFSLSAAGGKNLIIRDPKNKLVDISDFRTESSSQMLLAKSMLLNEVTKAGDEFMIRARRIYRPNAVKSLHKLASSNLKNGTIYLMNSSHQDIAWMDSPENCISERDTMLITPLLEKAQKDPTYRFDIEDALMIKEYIERHPDKKDLVGRLLNKGLISCGSTYIQPYEEMYSGEALARQFYFGAKWLKDKFGYTADTYWNVDVPGRTPQMPQIMKKAGTNYLMLSRFEKGVFRWESPDGSSVLCYSPGHYADAFGPLQRSFYEAAEYLAASSLFWGKYFVAALKKPVIPLLSDWDMSPAKDYSHLINQWESIKQLEIEPGKAIPADLPEFKIVTGPEFMKSFEQAAPEIPTIKGERPAAWLYIHGPSHQKALKASREGDILLTAAEKFAVMDSLVKGYFADYPQQRLTEAWEAKIYPDHGWGGKQGQVTDDLFRKKFEFAREEAQKIVETSIKSIASYVRTSTANGIPVVVFNSLSWQRDDIVAFDLNFDKGQAFSVDLKNAEGEDNPVQMDKAAYHEDQSLKKARFCFIANRVPSLGYKTFYLMPLKTRSESSPLLNNRIYENRFYKVEFGNGGLSGIFDKELNTPLLSTGKFKGGEIFTMRSEGNGAGEFGNIQQPTMQGFDKTGNYSTEWENISHGPVFSSFKIKQSIRNAEVELTIIIYNQIKRIDFEVALLNWEGVLYREYRMALPLNMENGQVAYAVPFGVSRVGKDEIEGAAGERYKTPAVDTHPRSIENWIGASSSRFGVTLSSSVVVADYIDPTDNPIKNTLLQPLLLASRRSCHGEGNEYLQAGDHFFFFAFTSHKPGWENGFRHAKQANEKLHAVVNPIACKKASLTEEKSFFSTDKKNVIISAVKKAEDEVTVVLRLYEIEGRDTEVELVFDPAFTKAFQTSLTEDNRNEIKVYSGKISFKLGHQAIETIKLVK